jgi:hypothetical protein
MILGFPSFEMTVSRPEVAGLFVGYFLANAALFCLPPSLTRKICAIFMR